MNRDPQIQLYLDTVVAQIKFQEAHAEVWQELESHITELMDTGIDSGLSNDAAIENALRRMGDPIEVGQKLHLAHQPKLDWNLLGLGIGLFLFQTYPMYRLIALSLSELAVGTFSSAHQVLLSSLLTIVLGVTVFILLMLWNYQQLRHYGRRIYAVTLLTIALLVGLTALFLGHETLFNPIQSTHVQYIHVTSQNHQTMIAWESTGLLATVIVQMFAPLLLITGLAGIVSPQLWSNPLTALKWIGLLTLPGVGFSAINCRYAAITFAIAAIALVISSKAKWWQIVTTVAVLLVSFGSLYQPSVIEFQGGALPYFDQPLGIQIQKALRLILPALIWIRVMVLVGQLREPLGRSLGIGLSTLLGSELLLNVAGTPGLGLFPIDFYDVMALNYDTIFGTIILFGMLKTVVAIALVLSIHRRRTLTPSRYL